MSTFCFLISAEELLKPSIKYKDIKEILPDLNIMLSDLNEIIPEIKNSFIMLENICNSKEFSHLCIKSTQ